MHELTTSLRAIAEPTRLRLLSVLSRGELTVSELTRILGQSQPRVSRHLKLMWEAGLLNRIQEGSWVFFRMSETGQGATVARAIKDMIPVGDAQIQRDLERLDDIKRRRAKSADDYFSQIASSWDAIRSLYVPEVEIEDALIEAVGARQLETLVDLGTGTGRILQLFGDRIQRGIGIDSNQEMLTIARSGLEQTQLSHCQARKEDLYQLSMADQVADVVTIHHVLHFLDDPQTALSEAARILRPGGQALIVDFAPHDLEFLREGSNHRRLGFSDKLITAWGRAAGMKKDDFRSFSLDRQNEGNRLTVNLWVMSKIRTAKQKSTLRAVQ